MSKILKLYEDFHERKPRIAREVDFSVPRKIMVMGYCDFIGYTMTIHKRGLPLKHTFARGSKPLLCAGPDQNQLYLIEGRYHVTERGIVDLDARGREIED